MPMGTLRSAQWLSQLRHMSRFVAERRTVPRWALEDLAVLHELALSEVVPSLPLPSGSETQRVQVESLRAGLAALTRALATETEAPTAGVGPERDADRVHLSR